jgi:hypothetical protein
MACLLQLQQLAESERADVIEDVANVADLVKSEYGRRYLTRRPRAGCLTVAEAGASGAVLQALSGGKYFEVNL